MSYLPSTNSIYCKQELFQEMRINYHGDINTIVAPAAKHVYVGAALAAIIAPEAAPAQSYLIAAAIPTDLIHHHFQSLYSGSEVLTLVWSKHPFIVDRNNRDSVDAGTQRYLLFHNHIINRNRNG